MDRIGIVGCGLIGRAWAIVFARAGHPVAAYDSDAGALAANLRLVEGALAELERFGLLAEPPAAVRARIVPASNLAEAVSDCAYVQESVRETVDAKRAIYAELDRLAPPDCILASSTSYIPASAFSAEL